MSKKKVRIPNCWICKDIGLVIYNKKYNKIIYEMAASCMCGKAKDNSEKIPIVSDLLAKEMSKENFNRFKNNHPDMVTDLVG